MKRRRICVMASSRATYGYKRRIMRLIHESEAMQLQVVVTGMHLLPAYGSTIREIEEDGLPISAKVDMMIGGDSPAVWAKSLGVEMQGLAQVLEVLKPDILVVTGDRGEMFAAAATAAYMNIPVAHIQAGDLSGHIDGSARHAITKLSHIHFASCDDSARRVERLGEEPWRIFNVGAPQLDDLLEEERYSRDELMRIFGVDFDTPPVVVIQHPILAEAEDACPQMTETMEAIRALALPTIVIYPNADAGNQKIISIIDAYAYLPFISTHRNLQRKLFASLLANASVLVGNSSCGILEAPSFKLAAVNIGNRQRGRMQACNVLDVGHDQKAIVEAIRTARDDDAFSARLAKCVNPYGDGQSSQRIVGVLGTVELGKKLLDKTMTY